MIKKPLLIALCGILLLTAQSCGRSAQPQTAQSEADIFKSSDRGLTWQQRSLASTENVAAGPHSPLNLRKLFFDPHDETALYATAREGVWLSIDEANTWVKISDRTADALGLDPNTRGKLYLASGQKIYKTTDVGKNWVEVYRETRSNVTITDVVADPTVPTSVWAGTSAGDVIVSDDEGNSWKLLKNLGNKVVQISPSSFNKNLLYAGTESKGIFQSLDRGETWENLLAYYEKREEGTDSKGKLVKKTRKDVEKYIRVVLDPTRGTRLYYLSRYGILRSNDQGRSWEELPLLTAPGTLAFFDLQVNARDGNELFYASEKVVYHSIDFGAQWSTISIPTQRRVITLAVNPVDPTRVYIGTDTPPQSKKKSRSLFNF